MAQVKTESHRSKVVPSSNTVCDWDRVTEIAENIAVETNESKLTMLAQRLLEALGKT